MLVLDTGAWLAWTSVPSRLSQKAVRAILDEEQKGGLAVSAVSVRDIAQQVARGALVLDRDVRAWVAFASTYPGLNVLPVDPADALESALLPGDFPGDASSRLIVALARRLDCAIVTGDRELRAYRHVKTIF